MVKLPWALECQLQRDAGLSFIEYHVLARLSENPDHTLRMSVLAELTHASLSRLSHLVKRLELRGLVRREPDPTDGRYTNAILTRGRATPSHRQRARARCQGPRAGDRRAQPGRAAPPAHGVRTNHPTNRSQRPIAGDRLRRLFGAL